MRTRVETEADTYLGDRCSALSTFLRTDPVPFLQPIDHLLRCPQHVSLGRRLASFGDRPGRWAHVLDHTEPAQQCSLNASL